MLYKFRFDNLRKVPDRDSEHFLWAFYDKAIDLYRIRYYNKIRNEYFELKSGTYTYWFDERDCRNL